jgi:hypothetical protein
MRAALLVIGLAVGFGAPAMAEEITVSAEGRAEVTALRIIVMALSQEPQFGAPEERAAAFDTDQLVASIRRVDPTARPCAPIADNDPDLNEYGAPSWSAELRRSSSVTCREIAASSLARVEEELGSFRNRARIVFQAVPPDPAELRRSAVRRALVMARASASEIAEAAGLRLGEVIHIQGSAVSDDAANAGRALSPLVSPLVGQNTERATTTASTSAFLTVTFAASR